MKRILSWFGLMTVSTCEDIATHCFHEGYNLGVINGYHQAHTEIAKEKQQLRN